MRRGGLALVTIMFLSVLVRVWVPQAQTPAGAQSTNLLASRGKDAGQTSPKSAAPKSTESRYILALQEKIRDFFGREHSPDVMGQEPLHASPNLDHWYVPQEERAEVRFVIATVPDPVHTHLSLFFDRSIDAIELGAASQGYTFDRAVMPWHYLDDPNSEENEGQAKLRESFPGLMIFRSEVHPALLLFVVAETPTSGINEEQFHHALEIIHDIRRGTDSLIPPTSPEFGILGPVFSGSLSSLKVILTTYLKDPANASAYSGGRVLPVYSTVMGTSSIQSFQKQAPNQVRMSIFQEDATSILTALSDFVIKDLHYEEHDIAVLNEEETAYGSSYIYGKDAALQSFPDVLTLSFPRGISQFRSEYTKEFQSNSAQGNGPNAAQQEQRNLRLDLGVTGSDDDSVAPYAKAQTPLSQEGVMLAILSELHLREPKFILLRATDPLDELFLARYLRDKYPQGRLVVPTPDLLFPRDEGGQLDGVLGLNTYPLSPANRNWDWNLSRLCGPPGGSGTGLMLFPASSSAALYNAASMLIFRLGELAAKRVTPTSSPSPPSATSVETGTTTTIVKLPAGVPVKPDSSCQMSPDLWLTLVSRNSIHPIKVLQRSKESTFFPSSGIHIPTSQRNTRTPPTWYFSLVLCMVLLALHHRRSWTGGTLGHWQTPTQFVPAEPPFSKKAKILCLGGIILVGIYMVLMLSNTPVSDNVSCATVLLSVLLWAPLAVFVGLTSWDFWKRRDEHLLCGVFLIVALVAVAIGIGLALHIESEMVLWQQRALDLTSDVSPATPLLVLLLGLYAWFWYSLRGESLTDWRWPQLPGSTTLPDHYNRVYYFAGCIRELIRPFSPPRWILSIALGAVACLAFTSVWNGPGHVPLRSLEGRPFDVVYSLLLGLSLVVLIGTLLRTIALWREFRLVLTGLDRVGLKDALRRLGGFEWTVIWNPAWSVEKEGYKLVAREIQTIERLGANLGGPADSETDELKSLRKRIKEVLDLHNDMIENPQGSGQCPTPPPSATVPMAKFKQIQTKFAETAGLLCESFLDKSWQHLPAEDGSNGSGAKKGESSGTDINVGTAVIQVGKAGEEVQPPTDLSGLSQSSLRLAEEFVACVYSNFMVTVLLRVRGLVFSAVVMYVCVTFSTISYPFQPAPELSTLAIVLFLFSGAVIGYVYEDMHRDPTLSRMTSTEPGKLDSAFWTKFVTVGIAPLVALASTVYPPFAHLLYTLVGPLLQALR